jgi:hypothetical protein
MRNSVRHETWIHKNGFLEIAIARSPMLNYWVLAQRAAAALRANRLTLLFREGAGLRLESVFRAVLRRGWV